jgi:hypothetical protein
MRSNHLLCKFLASGLVYLFANRLIYRTLRQGLQIIEVRSALVERNRENVKDLDVEKEVSQEGCKHYMDDDEPLEILRMCRSAISIFGI